MLTVQRQYINIAHQRPCSVSYFQCPANGITTSATSIKKLMIIVLAYDNAAEVNTTSPLSQHFHKVGLHFGCQLHLSSKRWFSLPKCTSSALQLQCFIQTCKCNAFSLLQDVTISRTYWLLQAEAEICTEKHRNCSVGWHSWQTSQFIIDLSVGVLRFFVVLFFNVVICLSNVHYMLLLALIQHKQLYQYASVNYPKTTNNIENTNKFTNSNIHFKTAV